MVSQKTKVAAPDAPKRRSLLAILFVPDIGGSIRPLIETTSVFTNLIAMLFVMNGLFPKNHPALAPNSKVRLSLHEVIQTAWRNVSFTKDKLPQAGFFVAVVGCIVITTLAAIVAICSVFVGKAHAQMFTPPGGANDLGQQIVNYLFQGQTFTSLDQNSTGSPLSPVGTGSSNIIQCALYSALGYYSDAMLVIAAMILFYHLAWMTVETAHHGQVMGQRGNQVWAPIRLVFAIGLLVPVGSLPTGCSGGTGAGLNSGQILVITIAQWGSGLASNVWANFLTSLAGETFAFVQPPTLPVREIVNDTLAMYACQYAFNWQLDSSYTNGPGGADPNALDQTFPSTATQAEICEPYASVITNEAPPCNGTNGGVGNNPPWQIISNDTGATGSTLTNTTKFTMGNAYSGDLGLCGSYVLPAAPVVSNTGYLDNGDNTFMQNTVTALYNAQVSAYQDILQDAHDFIDKNMDYYMVGSTVYGVTNPNAPYVLNGNDLVQKYADNLTTQINAAMAQNDTDAYIQTMIASFTQPGWVAAGALFNNIARVQNDLASAAKDGMPKMTPPQIENSVAMQQYYTNSGIEDVNDSSSAANHLADGYVLANLSVQAFLQWLTGGNMLATAPAASTSLSDQQKYACMTTDKGPEAPNKDTDIIDWAFNIVDHVAGCLGVWHAVPAGGGGMENLLGIQFTGANPLAEVAAFGANNVNAAFELAKYGIVASGAGGLLGALGSVPAGQTPKSWAPALAGLGAAGSAVGGLLLMVAGILFTAGFATAFFVPLIPFLAFFFGTLTWVVSMIEAVIAVPLVAIAHLNPEGDGLPGDLARPAYFLLFQMFLRPVLMIFGLIAGFLIFYLGVSLLNALLGAAVTGSGGLSHGHYALMRLIYTVIYVVLVVSIVNTSFQLIQRLPDTALQWIGMGGIQGAGMGDAGLLEEKTAGVQAYFTQSGMQQIGQSAGSVGQLGATAARTLGVVNPVKE